MDNLPPTYQSLTSNIKSTKLIAIVGLHATYILLSGLLENFFQNAIPEVAFHKTAESVRN